MGLNEPSMWYFSGDVTRGQSLPRLSSYRPKTQLNFRSHNSSVALPRPVLSPGKNKRYLGNTGLTTLANGVFDDLGSLTTL